MNLEIDTGMDAMAGYGRIDRVQIILDAVIDGLPINATQAQKDDALVQAIMGEMRAPKRIDTVRNAFLRFLPYLTDIARRDGPMFDSVILELADLITERQ